MPIDSLIVFDVARNSYVDGPGLRTTVFLKGCNLTCLWCHNPESQNPDPEMLFFRDACTGCGTCVSRCPHHNADYRHCELCGLCAAVCPQNARRVAGEVRSVNELIAQVMKDKPFYETSGGGVTVSGGECMLQIDGLTAFLKACHEQGIHTAVDTAGCVPFERFERIIPHTDLFLYDVKAVTPALHRALTGADNTLILKNLEQLYRQGAKVLVRVPVVPGANTQNGEMERIADLVNRYERWQVELLPYHRLGENKYKAVGRVPLCYAVPSQEEQDRYKALFCNCV